MEQALINMGVEKELSALVAFQISRDKNNWAEFMMQTELRMEKPQENRAALSAFTIACSYLVAGLIPLMPYVFSHNQKQGLIWSSTFTLLCLVVLGYFKSRFTGQSLLKGTFKVR